MSNAIITIAIIATIVGGAVYFIARSREPGGSGQGGGSGPSQGGGPKGPQPGRD